MPPSTSARLRARAKAGEQRRITQTRVSEGSSFQSVLTRRLTSRAEQKRYREDPQQWAGDRLKAFLWSKQRDIVASVRDHKRTCVQSAHGMGKSWTAAMLAAWWIDVHPPGQALVVSTAPSYNQVHTILWEEIRKFHRKAGLTGRVLLDDHWINEFGEQVGFGQRPADHNQHSFQGHHRKYVLVLIDEACGVPEWLWTAAETITTGDHCRILAIGNPDDNASHFARVCLDDPKWHTIKISAFDSPNLTTEAVPFKLRDLLTTRSWVDDAIASWGEQSPVTLSKVYGEFADSDAGVIPLSWVYQAQQRWVAWDEAGRPEPPGRRIYGVDVARFGTDRTALTTRQGDTILWRVESWQGLDLMQTAGIVQARLRHPQSMAIVDAEGIGSGVIDALRHAGHSPRAFSAGAMTNAKDIAGVLGFPNMRSWMWWNGREALNPYRNPTLKLPPDDPDTPKISLSNDLSAPTWDVLGNNIIVEKKDDLRKRIGRSPDLGDSFLMALSAEHLEDGRETNGAGGLEALVPRDYVEPPRRGDRPRPAQQLRPRNYS